MRQILESCIELDSRAYEVYQALASACDDANLSRVFEAMAIEERAHVEWWSDLLKAWEQGLVPDIADEHGLLERLDDIWGELSGINVEHIDCANVDEMLNVAVRFEFFMMDPMFGELIELMQPGRKPELREAYSRHVLRLIEAVEEHYSRPQLAGFLAGALKRAYRDQQRLTSLAVQDQLTGLYNRRGILGQIEHWLSWSTRYDHAVGVILADVDSFKEINDEYGHEAGDRALRHIADALSGAVRASDLVGRFGGDEFVVLAPETDGELLGQLMQRIVDAVAAQPLRIGDKEVSLSLSAGAAWVPGGVEVGVDKLIALADRSMYSAKGAGRNRKGAALLVTADVI